MHTLEATKILLSFSRFEAPELPAISSPEAVADYVLRGRGLTYMSTTDDVFIKFRARDAGNDLLTWSAILDDARSIVRGLNDNRHFIAPLQTVLQVVMPGDAEPSISLSFDHRDVDWAEVYTLERFANMIRVAPTGALQREVCPA